MFGAIKRRIEPLEARDLVEGGRARDFAESAEAIVRALMPTPCLHTMRNAMLATVHSLYHARFHALSHRRSRHHSWVVHGYFQPSMHTST